jgi:hypothetical protein
VTLTHGPENVMPERKLVSENGRFCFEEVANENDLENPHGDWK